MWESLPIDEKQEYQKMILAFASLSEMFSQKSENEENVAPIINSKYQETVFQKAFNAIGEDIGNTSYDASINIKETGKKYIVGIKTFGFKTRNQKVAQFKKDSMRFAGLYDQIENNSRNIDGKLKSKDEINKANHDLYYKIAVEVAKMRNSRIRSSKENLKGFSVNQDDSFVESVYHVLMPSKAGEEPMIHVGEIEYDEIDIDNISVKGCTKKSTPKNFDFTDGKHDYRYTQSDSQLLMDFRNDEIVQESWDVVYAKNAYDIFSKIADSISSESDYKVTDELIVSLLNDNDEAEMFSGLNSFNGITKMSMSERKNHMLSICKNYKKVIDSSILSQCLWGSREILYDKDKSRRGTQRKADKREVVLNLAEQTGNKDFINSMKKLLYRKENEAYIPIPDSRNFHKKHPNFFIKNADKYAFDTRKDSEELQAELNATNHFNIMLEPSGQIVPAKLAQTSGKAIESCTSQVYLGLWVLREIFQLDAYEPLTKSKMEEIGYDAIRLYRTNQDDFVHMEFIWKDENLPQK